MAPELLVIGCLTLYDLNTRARIVSIGLTMMRNLWNISTKQTTLQASPYYLWLHSTQIKKSLVPAETRGRNRSIVAVLAKLVSHDQTIM